MKSIVLSAPAQFTSADAPEPGAPGPGEALVRVHRIGICGTDLHAYRGRQPFFEYPRILGHELGVEVLAIGPGVTEVRAGDRCSVEPYMNCGACIACRRGKPNCCASLRVLGVHIDGGMRERILVPARKLHVANDLSYEQLALVETLAIGAHAVARAAITLDEQVLVIGAGPIGLSVLQFARLALAAPAQLRAMDMQEGRRAFAQRMLPGIGALAPQADVAATERAVLEAFGGELPLVVIDATGSPASMNGAFQLVAPGGRLIFAGLAQADITFSDPHLHRREISLFASRNALAADFTRIIALIRAGAIDTRPWITHHATLDTLAADFPAWLLPESGTIKAMVTTG